jgi:hypothetical protein
VFVAREGYWRATVAIDLSRMAAAAVVAALDDRAPRRRRLSGPCAVVVGAGLVAGARVVLSKAPHLPHILEVSRVTKLVREGLAERGWLDDEEREPVTDDTSAAEWEDGEPQANAEPEGEAYEEREVEEDEEGSATDPEGDGPEAEPEPEAEADEEPEGEADEEPEAEADEEPEAEADEEPVEEGDEGGPAADAEEDPETEGDEEPALEADDAEPEGEANDEEAEAEAEVRDDEQGDEWSSTPSLEVNGGEDVGRVSVVEALEAHRQPPPALTRLKSGGGRGVDPVARPPEPPETGEESDSKKAKATTS